MFYRPDNPWSSAVKTGFPYGKDPGGEQGGDMDMARHKTERAG